MDKFVNSDLITNIWEIGSRDGDDALKMIREFNEARVSCFEPNPDTFKSVQEIAQNSNNRISAHQLALCDKDGEILFYKIDTVETLTSWEDGNPGASSIFEANPDYKFEKYAQEPILVSCAKPASLIRDLDFQVPNFIWMDVQGSEKLILDGFEEFLKEVDFIYVELSLKPIYKGQPLAKEVVNLLRENFLWYSNLTFGEWQFDGFFINKKYATVTLRIRDLLLQKSLETKFQLGIQRNVIPVKESIKNVLKRFANVGYDKLRKSNSRTLGNVMLQFLKYPKLKISNPRLVYLLRTLISISQPTNPLKNFKPSPIDIVITCHQKDFATLPLVIESIRINCLNPINRFRLITPRHDVDKLKILFPQFSIESDEDILSNDLCAAINHVFPVERIGWGKQQILKILTVMNSTEAASLIVDADTILLQPRMWFSLEGEQILDIAQEYNSPYMVHTKNFFGFSPLPISFVTHAQLMQKEVINKMFGGTESKIIDWICATDLKNDIVFSEFDAYGQWLFFNQRKKVFLAKWNNLNIVDECLSSLSYKDLQKEFGKFNSISFHRYF
jgi:FkbM family methyltransferase